LFPDKSKPPCTTENILKLSKFEFQEENFKGGKMPFEEKPLPPGSGSAEGDSLV